MVKTFRATKEALAFELHIDGKVEVKPLPNSIINPETIAILAEVHQGFIDWYIVKEKSRVKDVNFIDIAEGYFRNKGYELKEIEQQTR